MKKYLALLIFLFCSSYTWAHQIAIGLSSESIYVLEYWKFQDSTLSHNTLINNHSDVDVEVIVRKWKQPNQFNPKPKYEKQDTLLFLENLKAGQLYSSTVLNDGYTGLIEIFVDQLSIGLYESYRNRRRPKNEMENGLVFNQSLNIGSELAFDIVYFQLNFENQPTVPCQVLFVYPDFHSVHIREPRLDDSLASEKNACLIESCTLTNLIDPKVKSGGLYLNSTGELGVIDLIFKMKTIEGGMMGLQIIYKELHNSQLVDYFPIPTNFDFHD